VAEVSRFSCMQFLSVPGVYDYAGPHSKLALPSACMLPSPNVQWVGATEFPLFEAQYPARWYPCLRFDIRLATTAAKLGARMVRYSFPAGLFHSLLHAG